MFKLIKDYIGKLTYPKGAIKSELNEHWVEVLSTNLPRYLFKEDSQLYKYNYQGIEQNWWGVWNTNLAYLLKNTPLRRGLVNNE